MSILPNQIQNFRQKAHMSQETLAEQLAVSRQSVSKWEQGQSSPDLDKLLAMSQLFGISTDELLGNKTLGFASRDNLLAMGPTYVSVSDMNKSIAFYEQLLSMRVSTLRPPFAEFLFDKHCLVLMHNPEMASEAKAKTNMLDKPSPSDRFMLSFNVPDLLREQYRLYDLGVSILREVSMPRAVAIGETYDAGHYYFTLRDPDGNLIEISGHLFDTRRAPHQNPVYCQSCGYVPQNPSERARNLDGSLNESYCNDCFVDGKFNDSHQNLADWIDAAIPFWREYGYEPEASRKIMQAQLPHLDRWRKK